MMSKVADPIFEHLRGAPVPAELASMSEDVLSGLEAGRARRSLRRGAIAVCLLAGLIGVWVGANGDFSSAPEPAGLLAVPGSAPSQLLAV